MRDDVASTNDNEVWIILTGEATFFNQTEFIVTNL
jgi:hypothetical protein